jgi:hypothetical protein
MKITDDRVPSLATVLLQPEPTILLSSNQTAIVEARSGRKWRFVPELIQR